MANDEGSFAMIPTHQSVISKFDNDVQLKNIPTISFTFVVSNDIFVRFAKFVHPENVLLMY